VAGRTDPGPLLRTQRLHIRRQRAQGLCEGLELGAHRRALRRSAAGETRTPAGTGPARARQSAARLGRRVDRDGSLLQAVRSLRHPGLAGTHPIQLSSGQPSAGRCGVCGHVDHRGRADHPAPAQPPLAGRLVRRERADGLGLKACRRRHPAPCRPTRRSGAAGPRPRLAAHLPLRPAVRELTGKHRARSGRVARRARSLGVPGADGAIHALQPGQLAVP